MKLPPTPHHRMVFCISFLLLPITCLAAPLSAQTVKSPTPPNVAAASDEGRDAISGFQLVSPLSCELFAAEPDVANPVALYVDHQGRVFVCESFRQERGVEDNRNHPEWLNDDLAAQTVGDRLAYMKKHLGERFESYSDQDDQIRQLEDTDGDGRADKVSVFANRFNAPEMGTGAGLLSYQGKTFFTCIPDLWMLTDEDQNGVADSRTALHSGFGVRFAFRGHDMHGLVIGPDGRLYFSIGDRGYHVTDDIADPSSGAVFRCELDGSNLEVVATGLRNPQELAFDNFGNLFTGDNNSDSGDKARWVFVVPGGDTGWRMHYQYLPDRGPFNREKIWHPYHKETPAYIVPPVDNLGDGPSGLTYYPGTGFGPRFRNQFLLCDFRGEASVSGIRAIENEPVGAFWKIKTSEKPIWRMLATDIDFGPDGKLYLSDWVFGWVGENKGRVYTVSDPTRIDSDEVKQVRSLLANGFENIETERLAELLTHNDRRVRQESQFELVARNQVDLLFQLAESAETTLTRVHAVWGLEQLARRQKSQVAGEDRLPNRDSVFAESRFESIARLLRDDDPEICAQAAKLVGDSAAREFAPQVATLLAHDNLRTRYFAAMAIGQIGDVRYLSAIEKMLAENSDADPIVRHGGIMALVGIAKRNPEFVVGLSELAEASDVSVRIAACVALRKLKAKEIAAFLNDVDSRVVLEAARAIYDLQLAPAMDALANKISTTSTPDALVGRILRANAWVGNLENAMALSKFAANKNINEANRIEALKILRNWHQPPSVDPFLGEWRPRPAGNIVFARAAINSNLAAFADGGEKILEQLLAAIGELEIQNASHLLEPEVLNADRDEMTRVNALVSLELMKSENMPEILNRLARQINELPSELSGKVIEIMGETDRDRATELMRKIVDTPGQDLPRIKAALRGFSEVDGDSANALAIRLLDQVTSDSLPAEVRLDVINSVEQRTDSAIVEVLNKYREAIDKPADPTAKFVNTLVGGSADRGRDIFFGKTEVSCVRCHRIDGTGGEVGPDLSKIGVDKTRQYLLESIVTPNKTIAEGFTQTIVLTDDGLTHTGIIKSETESQMVLMDADGNQLKLDKETIEESKSGMSSMPKDLIDKLDMLELRDLIEFLKSRVGGDSPRVNEVQ